MAVTEKKGWSPYLAGALSGVLSIFSVWAAGKYFGASTTFVRSAGMIEKIIGSERVARMSYFIKEIPGIEWKDCSENKSQIPPRPPLPSGSETALGRRPKGGIMGDFHRSRMT